MQENPIATNPQQTRLTNMMDQSNTAGIGWHEQEKEITYTALNDIQATEVYNSMHDRGELTLQEVRISGNTREQ